MVFFFFYFFSFIRWSWAHLYHRCYLFSSVYYIIRTKYTRSRMEMLLCLTQMTRVLHRYQYGFKHFKADSLLLLLPNAIQLQFYFFIEFHLHTHADTHTHAHTQFESRDQRMKCTLTGESLGNLKNHVLFKINELELGANKYVRDKRVKQTKNALH